MRFISSRLPTRLQWLKTFQVDVAPVLKVNAFRKAAKSRACGGAGRFHDLARSSCHVAGEKGDAACCVERFRAGRVGQVREEKETQLVDGARNHEQDSGPVLSAAPAKPQVAAAPTS